MSQNRLNSEFGPTQGHAAPLWLNGSDEYTAYDVQALQNSRTTSSVISTKALLPNTSSISIS